MNHQDRPVRAIVLAAQRPGTTDPLAARFGVTHKCLVPLRGRELILHVLAALSRHRGIAEIVVSIEPEAFGTIDALAASLGMASRIRCVPAASNLAESILAAAGRHDGPLLVTTADNALLLPASVEAVVEGMRASDAVVAMAPESAVRAAHPEGQRRFYRFRDQGYSNCNLYASRPARTPTSMAHRRFPGPRWAMPPPRPTTSPCPRSRTWSRWSHAGRNRR